MSNQDNAFVDDALGVDEPYYNFLIGKIPKRIILLSVYFFLIGITVSRQITQNGTYFYWIICLVSVQVGGLLYLNWVGCSLNQTL